MSVINYVLVCRKQRKELATATGWLKTIIKLIFNVLWETYRIIMYKKKKKIAMEVKTNGMWREPK